jgi:hypothetical protein
LAQSTHRNFKAAAQRNGEPLSLYLPLRVARKIFQPRRLPTGSQVSICVFTTATDCERFIFSVSDPDPAANGQVRGSHESVCRLCMDSVLAQLPQCHGYSIYPVGWVLVFTGRSCSHGSRPCSAHTACGQSKPQLMPFEFVRWLWHQTANPGFFQIKTEDGVHVGAGCVQSRERRRGW